MAAVLRHGTARRLGGSMVQRAEAEGRRRLMHTKEQQQQQSIHDQVQEELARKARGIDAVAREVRQKKEELYDALAKAQQSFWTSSFRNRRILKLLAVDINPRPEDPQWRRMRFTRRATNLLEAAGLFAIIGVGSAGYRCYQEDKKAMEMEKESQERRVNG